MLKKIGFGSIGLVLLLAIVSTGCKPGTPPSAAFSATPLSGTAPLTVNFENDSVSGSSPITGLLWDFGEGGSSTGQSPEHTYQNPGSYNVTLTVITKEGEEKITKTNYITVQQVEPGTLIEGAFSDFLSPSVPIEEAVNSLAEAYSFEIEDVGIEIATEKLKRAEEAAMSVPGGLATVWNRSFAASGMVLGDEPSSKQGEADTGCPVPLVVVWVNGMNVTVADWLRGYNMLKTLVAQGSLDSEEYLVLAVYQVSATDRYFSQYGAACDQFLGGVIFHDLLCAFSGAAIDLGEAALQKITDWQEWADGLPAGSDLIELRDKVAQYVRGGSRVAIVAHSQGNFFARDALSSLGSDAYGDLADSVGVLSVGSPVTLGHFPMKRFSICADPVATIAPDPSCTPWDVNFINLFDPFAPHNFTGTYLTQPNMKSAILQQIEAYRDDFLIENPRGLGTLSVAQSALTLSLDQPSGSVTLANSGPHAIDWHLDESQLTTDALIINPVEGTLAASESKSVSISLNPNSSFLASASLPYYLAVVFTNACDETNSVGVEIEIADPGEGEGEGEGDGEGEGEGEGESTFPHINLSTNSVSLSAAQPQEVITVASLETNPPVPLRWQAVWSDSRITVGPPGNNVGNSTPVTIATTDTSTNYSVTVQFKNLDRPEDVQQVQVQVNAVKLCDYFVIHFFGLPSSSYYQIKRYRRDPSGGHPGTCNCNYITCGEPTTYSCMQGDWINQGFSVEGNQLTAWEDYFFILPTNPPLSCDDCSLTTYHLRSDFIGSLDTMQGTVSYTSDYPGVYPDNSFYFEAESADCTL